MFISELSKTVLDNWILVLVTTYIFYFITFAIYNIYLSPLSKYPGPLLCKISPLPNWYHSIKGDRHIWIFNLHKTYTNPPSSSLSSSSFSKQGILRIAPNRILFSTPKAYKDIHGPKANIYKTIFYQAWQRDEKSVNTLNCVERGVHGRKRRILNLAFGEGSLRVAEGWVGWHVGRWVEILGGENGDGDVDGEKGWTQGRDMGEQSDFLFFDIMSDLSFGRCWDVKEVGSELRGVPGLIHGFVGFNWVIGTSPFLPLYLALRPLGLDKLMESLAPAKIKQYHAFVTSALQSRLPLTSQQETTSTPANSTPEKEERRDLLHYIINAKDPETGLRYTREEVVAEAGLLVIAGADTGAVTCSGIFYYLTRVENRGVYNKLCEEIRRTFQNPEEIRLRREDGPTGKLADCKYLHAVIQESLRMCPPIPTDLPRVVLGGGEEVDGVWVDGGTEVGVSTWCLHFDEEIYEEPFVFRPERWIVGERVDGVDGVVTEDDVERAKSAFFPFGFGRGDCVGRRLAMVELPVIVARVVWGLDFEAVESGDGGKKMGGKGWEGSVLERERGLFPVRDQFISSRKGPVVRFRKRVDE